MKTVVTNLKYFFKLIRWFHELLGILPFVVLYAIIKFYSQRAGIPCELSAAHFVVLCLGVQLLMISGFILNDIRDMDIDRINKPDTHIVGKTISLKTAWLLFTLCTVLIFLISVFISMYIFKEWSVISFLVYTLSVAYSLYLKRSPLLGNITMGVLAGAIPLVIMFYAKDCLYKLHSSQINTLIWLYILFPFLIIIPRELSLDISDMEGDRKVNCKTLPLVIGIRKSKILVVAFLYLIIFLSFFMMFTHQYLSSTFLVIDLMLIIYVYKFPKAQTRLDYIKIGRFLWFIMIVGLLGFTLNTIHILSNTLR